MCIAAAQDVQDGKGRRVLAEEEERRFGCHQFGGLVNRVAPFFSPRSRACPFPALTKRRSSASAGGSVARAYAEELEAGCHRYAVIRMMRTKPSGDEKEPLMRQSGLFGVPAQGGLHIASTAPPMLEVPCR
jgi:hypothetical protein